MRLALGLFLCVITSNADPVMHHFQAWGTNDKVLKLGILTGWTNGFLMWRGDGAPELVGCLSKMSTDQAIAMVDKYYTDHPERWSSSFTGEMLRALTVPGSPCEGKNLWDKMN